MPKKKDMKNERSNPMLSLTIARSISEIIKFSVDENFRDYSFKALGVIDAKGIENEIYNKLFTLTENPDSLVPETISLDEESETQLGQTSKHMNLSEGLSQSHEKCETLSEYKPDLSQTIFSQICLQISQEQEQRRLREKNIFLNTNPGIISPEIYKTLFPKTLI